MNNSNSYEKNNIKFIVRIRGALAEKSDKDRNSRMNTLQTETKEKSKSPLRKLNFSNSKSPSRKIKTDTSSSFAKSKYSINNI